MSTTTPAPLGGEHVDLLIGQGWAFPARIDDHRIALARGSDDIEQAIRLILLTNPGERPMRPTFGCGIHALVFAPLDADTAGSLDRDVRTALERWEPRITVEDVTAEVEPAAEGRLAVHLSYRVNATNSPRTLVVPFYTVPPVQEAALT
ncbi:GPW/gp25 family protein [Kitasatospora sp. NPDC058048]|uniref:GPW/gp25 family protein n=1 Tax=Kitasatospora sp. NPDC058048 TaxID=3346313 RepID=UPI0036D78CBE